jgi:hypothetical protein
MSGDFDVTPEQFVAAGGDKDQEATTGRCSLQNGFLQIMICLSQNLLKIQYTNLFRCV